MTKNLTFYDLLYNWHYYWVNTFFCPYKNKSLHNSQKNPTNYIKWIIMNALLVEECISIFLSLIIHDISCTFDECTAKAIIAIFSHSFTVANQAVIQCRMYLGQFTLQLFIGHTHVCNQSELRHEQSCLANPRYLIISVLLLSTTSSYSSTY